MGCDKKMNYAFVIDLLKSDWLKSLAGGLIGSFIGALATVIATRHTIHGTIEANELMVIKQREQQDKMLWSGLLAEVIENLASLKDSSSAGGYHLKIRLAVDFWDDTKSSFYSLPKILRDALIRVYSMIHKHNELVLYDRYALYLGMGTVHGPIQTLQNKLKIELENLDKELCQFIEDRYQKSKGKVN